ncbi:gluconokinase [Cellulomonas sp. P22]|uniref:gluconokinase n=1 Tax=Cellulomonas sp. P22 TaxID=3373189 RepID=UPI0037AB6C8F
MTDGPHLVVMGVAGSGKTTVARLLAARLGRPFLEADDLHPTANVAKMTAGIPLTDADRGPWLRTIRDWMTAQTEAGRASVLTCSALRVTYRDVLRGAKGDVRFIHLALPPEVLAARLAARRDHFMPTSLLASQLATLEPLTSDEAGCTVEAVAPAAELAEALATDPRLTP